MIPAGHMHAALNTRENTDCLIDWLPDCLTGCLIDLLTGWLPDLLTGCLIDLLPA